MRPDQKTLLVLSPGFAASEKDSNCLPMQQYFVRTLLKCYPGWQIVILSFHYPFEKKTYSWNGATVIAFGGRNRGGLRHFFLVKKIQRFLADLHHQVEVKAVLSFWYGACAWVGKRFAAEKKIPHFCWILGQDARAGNPYVKKLRPSAEELIALSDFLQEEFERNHGIRPAHVIPPGVEAHAKNTQERPVDLLAAGSLIPLKRFEIFIELVAALRNKLPHLRAVLCGEGPERARLEKKISRLGLQQQIEMKGPLHYEALLRLMEQTKILVHPSSYEGFSGVCQEALSRGARVVSFCRAMKQEIPNWHIVHNETGLMEKCFFLLSDQTAVYEPTVPFSMEDCVEKMMLLFDVQA